MPRFAHEKLKELRGLRNQTDLAAALQRRGHGTTQTQISRWEAGQEPRAYILPDLADELGVTVDELFEDDSAETMPPFRAARGDVIDVLHEALTLLKEREMAK